MIIRKANASDYKGVERLLVEVNNLHQKLRPDIFIENAVKYDEKKFDEIISNDSTPVFVAVDDEGNGSRTLVLSRERLCASESIQEFQVAVYRRFVH